MKKIDFKLIEESRAGKIFISLMYSGGDADTEHLQEFQIEGVTWDNYKENLSVIEKLYNQYATLKTALSDYDLRYGGRYKDVMVKYGKEIALLFDEVPNDPAGDYQWKCYLSYIELIGYDNEGNKYESYL